MAARAERPPDGPPPRRRGRGRPGRPHRVPGRPEGAHKTTAIGDEPARFIFLSTHNLPAVAYYPDSDKVGVWTGDRDMHVMVRRGENLDYYDGET